MVQFVIFFHVYFRRENVIKMVVINLHFFIDIYISTVNNDTVRLYVFMHIYARIFIMRIRLKHFVSV